jgi:monoamine oxidase
MIGFVGGRLAWKLTNAGEPAAVDFGMSQLRRILGASVDQHLVSGRFTRWGADPNVRGAFAYGKPGSKGARENLSRPLGNHVFFAGEALGGGMAMTCGGAFVSGTQVAATVAKIVADLTVLFGRRLAASEIEFLR